MADDKVIETVTVLGSEEFLYVESDEPLRPAVVVEFTAVFERADGFRKAFFWEENLIAEPTKPRDPASTKKASRIKWKVNLNGNGEAEKLPNRFSFDVRGQGESGANIFARSNEVADIDTIKITKDPKLTRIMLHEFAKKEGDKFVFDPAPVEAFVESLTPQQKKMLLNYDVSAAGGNRLVVLITLYAKKPLRMGADFCQEHTTFVTPNATFTVFHCRGPRKGATLVCHTEHFLVNLLNGDTRSLIHATIDKRGANEWTDKETTKPVLFKIASMLPQKMCDGVMWSRIFKPNGTDVMKGNTMHGMINTVGCWMLFRNYNWPRSKFSKFEGFYCRQLRQSNDHKLVSKLLADEGYDFAGDESKGLSSSFLKFVVFDRNYAYLWFFHEIVGIKYISDKISYLKSRGVNDRKPHGLEFENTFPVSEADQTPAFNLPDEKTFAFHDPVERQKKDPKFKPDDSLWRENVLGFKAATGFIPETNGVFGALTKSQLDACSWADLYIYREPEIADIMKHNSNY